MPFFSSLDNAVKKVQQLFEGGPPVSNVNPSFLLTSPERKYYLAFSLCSGLLTSVCSKHLFGDKGNRDGSSKIVCCKIRKAG